MAEVGTIGRTTSRDQGSGERTAKGLSGVDPAFLAEIMAIKAIDNHAHPQGALDADGRHDQHFLCLACSELEFRPTPQPITLRLNNPMLHEAWRVLFDVELDGRPAETKIGEVTEARNRIAAERGNDYPAWVLRQMNIEIMLANRTEIIPGLDGPNFRWVSYGDALTLPFKTNCLHNTPDRAIFYPLQEGFLQRELGRVGLNALPPTLESYLGQVVTPALERQRREGAIALKFVSAYLRSLDFEQVDKPEAEAIYNRYQNQQEPSPKDYKVLQDFLVSYLIGEAGRLGMPVHFHTGGGAGQYFYVGGGNPVLLEPMINDPSLRDTTVVLIHGAYPWVGEASVLSMKPNVYVDFSAQPFLFVPDMLAGILRRWLEFIPEKLLYGTDAVPAGPGFGWEEIGWIANRTAREALAIALTGMMNDQEITRDRASELARMTLRDNAAKLYGFAEASH